MFTVRVEERRSSHVTACVQYVVHRVENRTILTLYGEGGPVSSLVPLATIALDEGTRVFVMNDNGKTVDTMRGRA